MAQVDGFFDCSDIKGESKDSQHSNTVELNSFNWGCSQQSSVGSATVGHGAGKVRANELHFRSNPSVATPLFFSFCGSGKPINKAIIYVRKAGGTQWDYITITLENVLVSSHKISMGYNVEETGGAGGNIEYGSQAGASVTDDWVVWEYVSLSYGKMTVQYNQQQTDGSKGPSTIKWIDFTLNTNG